MGKQSQIIQDEATAMTNSLQIQFLYILTQVQLRFKKDKSLSEKILCYDKFFKLCFFFFLINNILNIFQEKKYFVCKIL